MLVAQDSKGGRKVASGDVRGGSFTCPDCAAEVTMRVGGRRVAHFAHRAGQACNEERKRLERKRTNALRRLERLEKEREAIGQQALFDLEALVDA